jgi:hypothetical protein
MLKRRFTLALALAGLVGAAAPIHAVPAPAAPRSRGFGVRPQALPPAALRADLPRRIGWGVREQNWLDDNIRVDVQVRRQPAPAEQISDEWIARLRPGASPQTVARRLGCRVKRATSMPDIYVFTRDPDAGGPTANVAAVAGDVAYIEPNRICRICEIPNDQEYPNQWGLRMVKMPDAWALQKGTVDSFNPGIIVAVIDTGVSPTHEDLRDRLLPGYDVLNNDSDPSDDNGHGTHVAGIIGATTNNQIGIAGVAWEGVKILPIKAFSSSGNTDLIILDQAIRRAADMGAHVINVSAGFEGYSQAVKDAVDYALSRPQKPILVGAAGNESNRHLGEAPKPVIYPANYAGAKIIAVGAVGPLGEIAFYSNANSSSPDSRKGGVDLVAPGGNDPELSPDAGRNILSTDWDPFRGDNGYSVMQGTSFSAPFVSGAVALLLSEGLAPGDVETALYTSTDRRGATGRTESFGWGILDVNAALQKATVLPKIRWPLAGYPVETATTLLLADVLNAPSGSIQVRIDGTGVSGVSTRALGSSTQILDRRPLATGTHTLEIIATSPVTGRTRSAFVRFDVAPKVLAAGWHLLALPYTLSSGDPAAIFGGKPYRMARWIAASGEYAFYDPPTQRRDSRASFSPTGTGLASNPAGLGYWVKLSEATTLALPGDPVLASEYRIPLAKGWSVVGNPYVFPVGLAGVRYQVGSQTVTLAGAIQRGWLGRNIYAYVSGATTNPYVALSSTSGVLAPYQAAWFQAGTAGTLIIPGT